MGEQLTYGYVGDILKWDDNGDGTINVFGVATSPAVDLDTQSCDPEWLKTAMPKWFKHANVREQHSSIAAGKGKELTHADGDRWLLKTHVVDPSTVLKVKNRVLTGYSVGIRNGQVMRGKAAGKAAGGVIVGGDIVEISLVDRPCNPDATFAIAKSVDGGELVTVDAAGEVVAVLDVPADQVADAIEADQYGFIERSRQYAADGVETFGDAPRESELFSQPVDDAVDDAVDDTVDWHAAGGGDEPLSLFDDLDFGDYGMSVPEAIGDPAELVKAWESDDDLPVMITKGLLETLLNGPGTRDADGDGKTGEGAQAAKLAERRRKLREAQAKERDDARKHRDRMDAEAAQDSLNAGRQGRRMEQAEHARRMGRYDKALEVELTSGLSMAEHREAQRLMRDVLRGDITKSADVDTAEVDAEVVGALAELAISELEQLAIGAWDDGHDPWMLVEAVTALAKMFGATAPATAGDIVKAAGSAVDGSTGDGDIVAVAEIEKAVSQATQALQGQVRDLSAQLAEISKMPIPGGPVLIKSVSAPAAPLPAQAKASEYAAIAARPDIAPDVAETYRAAARLEAAKG